MLRPANFFGYARERYLVMLSKQAGKPRPWTADPILQQYRFCNVFREDDTTTKWIRAVLTEEAYGEHLIGAMVIARWFNRIETLATMLPPEVWSTPFFQHNLLYNWDDIEAWKDAMRKRLRNLKPLVTGAYMIKTPAKMNKLEGLLQCLGQILPDAIHLQVRIEKGETTLEEFTTLLAAYPYLGPFMAYEITTDLRHSVLADAPDIMTWANPGPGCARGLGRVLGYGTDHFDRHKKTDVELMQFEMQQLLQESTLDEAWPEEWPSWEMRDVEHTLCELDKYERARLGEGRPKQRYQGTTI